MQITRTCQSAHHDFCPGIQNIDGRIIDCDCDCHDPGIAGMDIAA